MHAVGPGLVLRSAVAELPGFLCREAEDGREPGDQAVERTIKHRARGTAARAVRRVAIERVLAHIEVKGGKIAVAECVDRGEKRAEVEVVDAAAHLLVEFGQAV